MVNKIIIALTVRYYRFTTRLFYGFFLKNIGSKSFIKKPMFLTSRYISVGRDVTIFNDARIEGIYRHFEQKFSPNIVIEDGVSIQQRVHITAADTLIIGKNTMISFDVSIQDTDHEYQGIQKTIASQPLKVQKTYIGENCFIGSGAKIQAGTILGKHCVIGTNAVVRGVFPDYSVIVGIPAKIIKRYNSVTKTWERTNEV